LGAEPHYKPERGAGMSGAFLALHGKGRGVSHPPDPPWDIYEQMKGAGDWA
jgi:hypothetical protein